MTHDMALGHLFFLNFYFYWEKPELTPETKAEQKSKVLNEPVHNDTEQNEV